MMVFTKTGIKLNGKITQMLNNKLYLVVLLVGLMFSSCDRNTNHIWQCEDPEIRIYFDDTLFVLQSGAYVQYFTVREEPNKKLILCNPSCPNFFILHYNQDGETLIVTGLDAITNFRLPKEIVLKPREWIELPLNSPCALQGDIKGTWLLPDGTFVILDSIDKQKAFWGILGQQAYLLSRQQILMQQSKIIFYEDSCGIQFAYQINRLSEDTMEMTFLSHPSFPKIKFARVKLQLFDSNSLTDTIVLAN